MVDQLAQELNLIENKEIGTFAEMVLSRAPAYFWTSPASSSGQHHYEDECKSGGQILHVRRAIRVAYHLCRNFEVTGIQRDQIIAALLIHDVCRLGYPSSGDHTDPLHGVLWMKILSREELGIVMDAPILREIARLACCHMGRFAPPYQVADDLALMIVQVSDVVSSRRDIKVEV